MIANVGQGMTLFFLLFFFFFFFCCCCCWFITRPRLFTLGIIQARRQHELGILYLLGDSQFLIRSVFFASKGNHFEVYSIIGGKHSDWLSFWNCFLLKEVPASNRFHACLLKTKSWSAGRI